MSEFTIALFKPLIPPNTGNIARLSVALNCNLQIVGKTPIQWNEPNLRRAGLDHWDKVKFHHFIKFKEFYLASRGRRVICVSKESSTVFWDFNFKEDDILLFGNETMGLPPRLLKIYPDSIRIPMWGEGVRSLNLSNSVAIAAYEAFRQFSIHGQINATGLKFTRTYYKKHENE